MQSAVAAENRIFQALVDPSRRAIFVSLTRGEAAVKDITARFDISQPAVSQHLKVLRESGFATVRTEGPRRMYEVAPSPLGEVDAWLEHFRQLWTARLDALATEIARGKRERRARESG